MRLQKYMAESGVASRRRCEEIILEGRVAVNGKIVTEMGVQVDPETDDVRVDGNALAGQGDFHYILLNKPKNVVTTMSDPEGRATIVDVLPDFGQRVYPVGRLDYATEGLLLLTNDGQLAHHIAHPSHTMEKTYEAQVHGALGKEALRRLREGVDLDGRMTAPAKVVVVEEWQGGMALHLTIHEGRNRQIRRMIEAVGGRVGYLRRIGLGPLTLQGITEPGQWRRLTTREVERLWNGSPSGPK